MRRKGYSNYYYAYLKTELNTCDAKNFPSKGQNFNLEAGVVFNRRAKIEISQNNGQIFDVSNLINNKQEFYKLRINYTKYIPFYKNRVSFFYNLQAGLTYRSQGFLFDNYQLGGVQYVYKPQMTFVGLNEGQITTNSCGILMMGIQSNIIKDLYVNTKVNAAIYDFSDDKNIFVPNKEKVITGFSAGIGYNLSLFPLELNLMYSPEIKKTYFNLKIGFIF